MMKIIMVYPCRWLILVLLMFLIFTKYCGSADWKEVEKIAKDNTVMIVVYNPTDSTKAWGTGIIIGDSIVATCAHTLLPNTNQFVFHNKQFYEFTLLDSTSGKDGLAILKVNTYLSGGSPAFNSPKVWEDVLIYGYPRGFPMLSLVEKVNSLSTDANANYDIYTIQRGINAGISGAGVWNKDGELVGMIWGVRAYQYIALTAFLSSEAIKKMYYDYLTIQFHSRNFNRQLRRNQP